VGLQSSFPFATFLSTVCRNLRLAIDSKTHSSMVSLFALSFPQMFPPAIPHVNLHINSFLYSDSALPALPQPEFVPMFARTGRLGGARELHNVKFDHPSIPNALPGLSLMLPELAVVEDEDNDLYKQHMVIIDGWRKFFISLLGEPLYSCHLCRNISALFSLEHRYPIACLWN
jgi:hypothetical protein